MWSLLGFIGVVVLRTRWMLWLDEGAGIALAEDEVLVDVRDDISVGHVGVAGIGADEFVELVEAVVRRRLAFAGVGRAFSQRFRLNENGEQENETEMAKSEQ